MWQALKIVFAVIPGFAYNLRKVYLFTIGANMPYQLINIYGISEIPLRIINRFMIYISANFIQKRNC